MRTTFVSLGSEDELVGVYVRFHIFPPFSTVSKSHPSWRDSHMTESSGSHCAEFGSDCTREGTISPPNSSSPTASSRSRRLGWIRKPSRRHRQEVPLRSGTSVLGYWRRGLDARSGCRRVCWGFVEVSVCYGDLRVTHSYMAGV